jgi:hypothetical protein
VLYPGNHGFSERCFLLWYFKSPLLSVVSFPSFEVETKIPSFTGKRFHFSALTVVYLMLSHTKFYSGMLGCYISFIKD